MAASTNCRSSSKKQSAFHPRAMQRQKSLIEVPETQSVFHQRAQRNASHHRDACQQSTLSARSLTQARPRTVCDCRMTNDACMMSSVNLGTHDYARKRLAFLGTTLSGLIVWVFCSTS